METIEKLWLKDERTGLVDPLHGAEVYNLAWTFEDDPHGGATRLTQIFLMGRDGQTYSIRAANDGWLRVEIAKTE